MCQRGPDYAGCIFLLFRRCPPDSLLLALAWWRGDLAGGHEIANVLLEELVVAVELVVLFADGFDAVEDGEQRLLECLRVSGERWLAFSSTTCVVVRTLTSSTLPSPLCPEPQCLRSSSSGSLPSHRPVQTRYRLAQQLSYPSALLAVHCSSGSVGEGELG